MYGKIAPAFKGNLIERMKSKEKKERSSICQIVIEDTVRRIRKFQVMKNKDAF
jgi:hypothetical protein